MRYSDGDKNFLRALTSGTDVAKHGQRKLKWKNKYLKIVETLREKGLDIPLKRDGSEYKVN